MDAAYAFTTPPPLTRPRWREALQACVRQEPLLMTAPSLAALDESDVERAPGAVMIGVGLCSPEALSRTMPYDLLGLVLPAELLRRAVGASTIVALVADVHAEETGFDGGAVERRARAASSALLRLRRRLGLDAMCVVRASHLHASTDYRAHFRTAQARAGTEAGPYLVRQVADVACLDARLGGVLKLGWMVGRDRDEAIGDEAAFDRWVEPWTRHRPIFAYARAGRTFDPSRPKAAPYVETDPSARISLAPTEDVRRKLGAQPPSEAASGVRNHLRAIARTYARVVGRVRGPVEDQTQAIIDRIYRPLELDGVASKWGSPNSSSIPGMVATNVSTK